MERTSQEPAVCIGKAALKTHALQTLRDCRGRRTARSVWSASDLSALSVGPRRSCGSCSQCTGARPRGLSMWRTCGHGRSRGISPGLRFARHNVTCPGGHRQTSFGHCWTFLGEAGSKAWLAAQEEMVITEATRSYVPNSVLSGGLAAWQRLVGYCALSRKHPGSIRSVGERFRLARSGW